MEIESDLTCAICSFLFEKPTTVICGHTFCNECIIKFLGFQPKCPVCKYPILGFQKLNSNVAVQAIVEVFKKEHPEKDKRQNQRRISMSEDKKNPVSSPTEETSAFDVFYAEYREEVIKKDINLSTIEQALIPIKCIGFEVRNPQQFRYFPGTSYEIEIVYTHSDELFKLLIPDHYFIGFSRKFKGRNGYLFVIEKIQKFRVSSVKVVARCKGHLKIATTAPLDFSEHKEIAKLVNDDDEQVLLNFVSGFPIVLKQPTEIPADITRKIASIEIQVCHFLNLLKETNEYIAEQLIQRYGIDSYGKRLSIDWKVDVHSFLNSVGSMLCVPDKEKTLLSKNKNYVFRVNLIYDFLKPASSESDPIFFLNYGLKNSISDFWGHIGFVIAVLMYVISVFYPQYKLWEFK